MVRFEHSHILNTNVAVVWQVLGDITNWPTLFPELSRIQVSESADNVTNATGFDSRGRNFNVTVLSPDADESGVRTLTVSLDPQQLHPAGYRQLSWTLSPQSDKTLLTLIADYKKPMPLVGPLLTRLRGGSDAQASLKSAFDAVVHQAHEQVWKYQETVQTILSRKGVGVISARPTDSVKSICTLINTHRIGAVLVLEANDELVGLVSERDIVYHLATTGPGVLEQQVSDIMTRDLIVCEPQSDLLFVMACMTDNKIRHLPVIDNGDLCGLISIGDVVQQRIHSLEAESGTLRDYIAAREWRFHNHHGVPVADPAGTVTDIKP